MSQETRTVEQVSASVGRATWRQGVEGGLLAGLVMGVVFSLMSPGLLEAAIPSLVGLSGGIVGWVVHMSISAVFGVVFVAALTLESVRANAGTANRMASFGLVYGIVLWVIASGLVMPIWLSAVGFPGAPAVPNLALQGLLTHMLFGVVLGITVHYLR